MSGFLLELRRFLRHHSGLSGFAPLRSRSARMRVSGSTAGDIKAVIEQMATVGYKELNESGEFAIPGFVKMSIVNKPATEARSGVNPFTKEPMEFAAKPASKSVKASPLKVAKDAV
jgi:nucleoid DNA-binding protein